MEDSADEFARKALIDEEAFNNFINRQNLTETDVINFANQQNVQPFIVAGRIQKEKNNFRIFSNLKVKYKWK